MSDRPMRLKYLAKMKIILCIFLLYITAVSVFGQSVELNGILGESVKFPAAVKKVGNLMHSGVRIGDVTGGSFRTARNEKFSGRLQWDSSTGLFSLSELKMEDSGEYKVQNTDQNINTVFQLNVYKDNVPVLKPHVSITHNEYPCTIECTAERGTGVTLSWYREGKEKPYVSSRVASAPPLHLPQSVERSGTYTCEAKNSVSNEKASITVEDHCTAGFSTGTIVLIVLLFVFICVIAVPIYLLCSSPAGSSRGIVVLVPFLVFALSAVLICLLCFSPAGSSTWTVVLVSFLIVALIAVLICFCIKRKILEIRSKHRDVRRLILVKLLLDNIVAPASASSILILVQVITEEMVAPAHDKKMQALRSNVKKLLEILVAPASVEPDVFDNDIRSLIRDVNGILYKVDPRAYHVNDILYKVDPRAYQLHGLSERNPELE